MKDKSQMQKKAKQLLARILSTQITGMLPFMAVLSTVTVNVVYAGTNPVPSAPPVTPAEEKSEGLPAGGAYMQENSHGSSSTYSGNAPKKGRFCRDPETDKITKTCAVVGVLLGIAAIVALVMLTRNRGRCSGACGRGGAVSGGSGNSRPSNPGRPNNPGPSGPGERPPVVPCCNNPAPAPAPAGGGTTQTSTVTTGSAPAPGVEPIVVNP